MRATFPRSAGEALDTAELMVGYLEHPTEDEIIIRGVGLDLLGDKRAACMDRETGRKFPMTPDILTAIESGVWRNGELIWVDSSVCELINLVQADMHHEPLDAEDWPSPEGIVMFGAPVNGLCLDTKGTEPIYAIGWIGGGDPYGSTVNLISYISYHDMHASALAHHSGGRDDSGVTFRQNTRDAIDDGDILEPWEVRSDLIPSYMAAWGVGDPPSMEDHINSPTMQDGRPREDHPIVYGRRLMLALWRFMRDEVVVVEPAPLDRARRRRSARSGHNFAERARVVHLRKVRKAHPDETDTEAAHREWKFRFRQRAHERTLHRGTPQERKVWVREGIKGPEGLPFRAPARRIVSVDR